MKRPKSDSKRAWNALLRSRGLGVIGRGTPADFDAMKDIPKPKQAVWLKATELQNQAHARGEYLPRKQALKKARLLVSQSGEGKKPAKPGLPRVKAGLSGQERARRLNKALTNASSVAMTPQALKAWTTRHLDPESVGAEPEPPLPSNG